MIERLTNQKKAILDHLRAVSGHPDAYEIYEEVKKKLPQISLATVYRNLDTMVSKGMIKAIRIKDDRFNYDGHEGKHHHFHCVSCNRVYNIPDNILLNLEKINEEGIVDLIEDYSVMLKGTCMNCKRKKNKEKTTNPVNK